MKQEQKDVKSIKTTILKQFLAKFKLDSEVASLLGSLAFQHLPTLHTVGSLQLNQYLLLQQPRVPINPSFHRPSRTTFKFKLLFENIHRNSDRYAKMAQFEKLKAKQSREPVIEKMNMKQGGSSKNQNCREARTRMEKMTMKLRARSRFMKS